MFAKKRINEIAGYLKTNYSATVAQLANQFNVSEVTIRKDLSILEDEKLIERSFGGAIWLDHLIANEIPSEVKMVSREHEKRSIAEKIVKEIEDGNTIYLDAGSTNNILVDFLDRFSNLTILTNDLLTAIKIAEYTTIRIIFIGGEVSNVSKATVDYTATKMLSNYNVDLSIMGCDSFSVQTGACTTSVNKATLKSTAMSISKKVILSTTSDKYFKRSLVKFAQLNEFDKIYTDNAFIDTKAFKEHDDIIIDFN